MNTIDAAHEVLHQIPDRVDVGGIKNPGATAYYVDVPVSALPSHCKLTPAEFGFVIHGAIGDCQYRGHAIPSDRESHFSRVRLSFVKQDETFNLH
jgi:hypothetical protein